MTPMNKLIVEKLADLLLLMGQDRAADDLYATLDAAADLPLAVPDTARPSLLLIAGLAG